MNEEKLIDSIIELACELDRGDINLDELVKEAYDLVKKDRAEQLTLTDVGNCPFEAYAVFCIECDRKGLKPIKYKDYLKLG
jgi:hypothetical protein